MLTAGNILAKRISDDGIGHFFRDGIELEKGILLTKERILKNQKLYEAICDKFITYPDLFIDLITPVQSNFQLYFYQRIFLRACMRYSRHYCTAPRAFSKTFLCVLALILKAIFQPGSKGFICAPSKDQSSKIAAEKIDEILTLFPLLEKEIAKRYTAKDNIKLVFRNKSVLDIVGALDTTRGGRKHYGLVDEVRDHDGDTLNEIVLPLLNVARRTRGGLLNYREPHAAQFFMTSAGTKNSYAYQKAIEILEQSIYSPKTAFCWGCDYKVPMLYGLLERKTIREIQLSQTYKDESFAREYCARWTGGGTGSWLDFDRLTSMRKLHNPEQHRKNVGEKKFFYFLSVDVGRLNCQTVCNVFKVFEKEEAYRVNLVNVIILGKTKQTKHFKIQAADLKQIIQDFDPVEVVIDGNGLGVGILDEMVYETITESGNHYPAYCSFNNADYNTKLYPKAIPLIYVMKDNDKLTQEMNRVLYTWLSAGKIKFLERESIIRNKLLATPKGQAMTLETRTKRLIPHEMTSRLIEEIANFKVRTTGAPGDYKLEKINRSMLSDKFSSLLYGIYRIDQREKEYIGSTHKKKGDRTLIFF